MSRGFLLLFVIGSAVCPTTLAKPYSGSRPDQKSRRAWKKRTNCPAYLPIDVSNIQGNKTWQSGIKKCRMMLIIDLTYVGVFDELWLSSLQWDTVMSWGRSAVTYSQCINFITEKNVTHDWPERDQNMILKPATSKNTKDETAFNICDERLV